MSCRIIKSNRRVSFEHLPGEFRKQQKSNCCDHEANN